VEGEDRETQLMVPITEVIRPTEDRDTTSSCVDKDRPLWFEALEQMIMNNMKEEMRNVNDGLNAIMDSQNERIKNMNDNMHTKIDSSL
jgi:hypothetical protein